MPTLGCNQVGFSAGPVTTTLLAEQSFLFLFSRYLAVFHGPPVITFSVKKVDPAVLSLMTQTALWGPAPRLLYWV